MPRSERTRRSPQLQPHAVPAPIDPALPGADLLARGLADLAAGARTAESLLVQIGAPRLRALGIDIPDMPPITRHTPASTTSAPETASSPEMALYGMLAAEDPDTAHSRYNALVRALVSFERAAESAAR